MFQTVCMKFGTYFKNCRKKIAILELCRLRSTGEWDDVADVLHACNEQDEALETKSESCVWA